jgi:uncharacterized integral membrane protein
VAQASKPGGQRDPAGGASRRGVLSRFAREIREGPEQGRYVALAVGAVLALYVIGLIVANYKTVRISFVLGSAAIPLLWLIILCVGLGVGIGWILRGRRDRSRAARETPPPTRIAR